MAVPRSPELTIERRVHNRELAKEKKEKKQKCKKKRSKRDKRNIERIKIKETDVFPAYRFT